MLFRKVTIIFKKMGTWFYLFVAGKVKKGAASEMIILVQPL